MKVSNGKADTKEKDLIVICCWL